jgi:hypothetical protein
METYSPDQSDKVDCPPPVFVTGKLDHVVAGSFKNKLQAAAGHVLPTPWLPRPTPEWLDRLSQQLGTLAVLTWESNTATPR